jgi:hypothetical protein
MILKIFSRTKRVNMIINTVKEIEANTFFELTLSLVEK